MKTIWTIIAIALGFCTIWICTVCAQSQPDQQQMRVRIPIVVSRRARRLLEGQSPLPPVGPVAVPVGRSISSNTGVVWPTLSWTALKLQKLKNSGTTTTTTTTTKDPPAALSVLPPFRSKPPNSGSDPKLFESKRIIGIDGGGTSLTPDGGNNKLRKVIVKKYSNVRRPGWSMTTTATTTTTPATTTIANNNKSDNDDDDDDKDNDDQIADEAVASLSFESSEPEPEVVTATGRGASGIDPHHPAVQQAIASHNEKLHTHPAPIIHQKPKRVRSSHDSGLLPLDKTLVYVGMIFSWIFWIVVFTTYYTWGQKHGHPIPGKPGYYKNRPVVLNINQHGHPSFQQVRSQGQSDSNWSWPQLIYMISLAEETYEKFDLQSLECQKKALCELAEEQSDGISSAFSYVLKRFLDAVETLPLDLITYIKEYRAAIENRNSKEDCASVYNCKFSLKEVFYKYRKLQAVEELEN